MPDHLINAYRSLPVNFTHGDGCYLWDSDGKQYLDALCGISVTNLGHNYPPLTAAIQEQAATLLHTSNLYSITWQSRLADLLCAATEMDRVFFANSGAEANEAAIKLARLYGHQQTIKDPHIVVMQNAFHGRTMATLSATGSRKVQAGFEPLVSGFVRAPYNDIAALEAIAENNRKVVAILVEPVQGEAGIVIPDSGYLVALRKICDQNNWLLMLDEVQTGMARSGKMFAHQHEPVLPDVMTLAKALGNGVPVGACIARGKAAEVFQPGNHGSTFGGNPLASRAAYTVLTSMLENKIADNAAQRGAQLFNALQQGLFENRQVQEVRHLGLLMAVEMRIPCQALVAQALQQGLLINVTAERTIRLLPPLILSEMQTGEIADKLITCINQFTE
ncbi:MAG: aspartate aminotransferase family protein [Gammaproteobacteria bacterium]|nr:aspartate aminotransferase family protein [Gammaproteobacteria bacterium]MDH3857795.1 aspartate aminotransferase family protein [Gammaproteobacteria bacterium]